MKRVRVPPDGSCLFTSLRLGLEALGLLKSGQRTGHTFSGHDPAVLKSAQRLRCIVCNFYTEDKWNLPVTHDTTRKMILQAELSKHDVDVTDQEIVQYLVNMAKSTTWGSQPEYIAFSYMARVTVQVYSYTSAGPVMVDSVGQYDRTVSLLFGGNHYDLLVSNDDATALCALCPESRDAFCDAF